MSQVSTLRELLAKGANGDVAIAAPGMPPLTYADLRQLVDRSIATLNGIGVSRNDRVAIVLPNGPEMATAFVAIAAGATAAPLNPAYRADEFEFYMSDIGAKALVVEKGSESPAAAVARKLGVRVVELATEAGKGAGSFSLGGGGTGAGIAAAGSDVHWACSNRRSRRLPVRNQLPLR